MIQNFINIWINKTTKKNTNLIYTFCILVSCVIVLIVNRHSSSWINWIEIAGTFIQIALPCYAIVPVLWKKDKQGALQMLCFLSITLIIVFALKIGLNERRPYGGKWSFPSGHTAGAFIGALFLSLRYYKYYILCSFPLAIFVSYSRIISHNHWISDVLASVAITTIIALIIVRPLNKKII